MEGEIITTIIGESTRHDGNWGIILFLFGL